MARLLVVPRTLLDRSAGQRFVRAVVALVAAIRDRTP
jgi:hypothetical protein